MFSRMFASAVALFLAQAAQADVTVETVFKETGKTASLMMVAGGKAYMSAVEDGREQSWVIWDGQRIISGSPAQKVYMVMDQQTAAETGRQLSEAMKQAEQMMANLPPAMRKQMEEAMKAQGGGAAGAGALGGMIPKATVNKTGRRDKAAGHDCRIVEWRMGDLAHQEYCVVQPGELGLPAADLATLKAMSAFVRSMTEQMSGSMGAFPDSDEIGGYPVRTVDKKTGSVRLLKSLKTGAVDARKFQIPAGYREQKIEMPEF